jgi:hypothetical protein
MFLRHPDDGNFCTPYPFNKLYLMKTIFLPWCFFLFVAGLIPAQAQTHNKASLIDKRRFVRPDVETVMINAVNPVAKFLTKQMVKKIAIDWSRLWIRQDRRPGNWKAFINIGRQEQILPFQSRLLYTSSAGNEDSSCCNEQVMIGINDITTVDRSFSLAGRNLFFMDIPVKDSTIGDVSIHYYKGTSFEQANPGIRLLLSLSNAKRPFFRVLSRANYLGLLTTSLRERKIKDSTQLEMVLPVKGSRGLTDRTIVLQRFTETSAYKENTFLGKLVVNNYVSDSDYIKAERSRRYGWIDSALSFIDSLKLQMPRQDLTLPAVVDSAPFLFDGFKDSTTDGKYIVEIATDQGGDSKTYPRFITVAIKDAADNLTEQERVDISSEQLSVLADSIVPAKRRPRGSIVAKGK